MIYGNNFKLEIEDLNIDTTNIYDGKNVIALIDTDSNYINLEPMWDFIKNNENYEFIIENIKSIIDFKCPWFNKKNNKDDFEYFAQFHDLFVIEPVLNDSLLKFSTQHNLMNIGEFKHKDIDFIFELEDLLKYDLVLAKKKYAKILYGSDKIKFTGLETKKTDSSKFVRQDVAKFFEKSLSILDKYGITADANIKMNELLREIKKKFVNCSTEDIQYIGEPAKVKTYNASITVDKDGIVTPKKGAGQGAKF